MMKHPELGVFLMHHQYLLADVMTCLQIATLVSKFALPTSLRCPSLTEKNGPDNLYRANALDQ
jgi:hypothetical protein